MGHCARKRRDSGGATGDDGGFEFGKPIFGIERGNFGLGSDEFDQLGVMRHGSEPHLYSLKRKSCRACDRCDLKKSDGHFW